MESLPQESASYTVALLIKSSKAIAVFTVAWLAAKVSRIILRRMERRVKQDKQHVLKLLGQTTYAGLLIIGVITALATAGINVTALVASLGLAGFALGFALKDALSNLLAGVLILLYEPFEVGERISAAGHEGTVRHIDFRYTTLANEGKTILLPNSLLFTNSIVVHREQKHIDTPQP